MEEGYDKDILPVNPGGGPIEILMELTFRFVIQIRWSKFSIFSYLEYCRRVLTKFLADLTNMIIYSNLICRQIIAVKEDEQLISLETTMK